MFRILTGNGVWILNRRTTRRRYRCSRCCPLLLGSGKKKNKREKGKNKTADYKTRGWDLPEGLIRTRRTSRYYRNKGSPPAAPAERTTSQRMRLNLHISSGLFGPRANVSLHRRRDAGACERPGYVVHDREFELTDSQDGIPKIAVFSHFVLPLPSRNMSKWMVYGVMTRFL